MMHPTLTKKRKRKRERNPPVLLYFPVKTSENKYICALYICGGSKWFMLVVCLGKRQKQY